MKLLSAVVSCVLISAIPASAETVGESTGVNSVLGIAPKTADFVTEAAISDMFEIEASKLAQAKADELTKKFAAMMVNDHMATSADLKLLAANANMTVPTGLDKAHQSMLDTLKGLSGADFTKEYRSDQVTAHKEAVSLFERYAKGGDNNGLKSFANKTLPTLQNHLKMARDLYQKSAMRD